MAEDAVDIVDILAEFVNTADNPEHAALGSRAMLEIERLREYEWMYKDLAK